MEAIRDGMEVVPFPKQKIKNDQMLALSRMVEMTTETMPQIFIQMVALVITKPEERQLLQYASVSFSLVSAGWGTAITDRAMDLNEDRRRSDPKLYGYVPKAGDGRNRQLLFMVLFFTCYLAAKTFSLVILLTAADHGFVVPLILFIEFFIFLGIRIRMSNWRLFIKGVDTIPISLLAHCICYISILSAPFPLFRMPGKFPLMWLFL